MGTQLPLPKTDTTRQFWARVYCGETAAWIKMPLGMEVGLGRGDFVLDEALLPNFRPMSIVAKRLVGSRRHLARRWALVQATLH